MMMKRISAVGVAVCVLWSMCVSAKVSYRFGEPFGGCWYAPQQPALSLTVLNDEDAWQRDSITLLVTTDRGESVYRFAQGVCVAPRDSSALSYSFSLNPGFYKCVFSKGDSVIRRYTIGYEPERIVALSDEQPDFDGFWAKAKAELAEVAPEYTMVEDTVLQSKYRKCYHVTMKSLGGELLRCYLLMPKKKGNHPAIIHFQGYNSGPWAPDADSNPDYIEFVLSVRGQGWNKPYNTHGVWLTENLDDADNYYYRGAYMDVVRGIDFVTQLPQFDGVNLFAEGHSQGGLLTLVAAAFDDRVVAAAPSCPFLGDIPSYLDLGSDYVKQLLRKAFAEQNITKEQFVRNMSYFDLKNLCKRIKVPVYMAVGLQDPICQPYTNFAGYNVITSPKKFVIYQEQQHSTDKSHWEPAQIQFFESYKK